MALRCPTFQQAASRGAASRAPCAFRGARPAAAVVSRDATSSAAPLSRPLAAPALLRQPSRAHAFQVHAAAKTAFSTVRIIIQGRRLPVTDAIKEYVQEKVAKAIHNFQHTLKEVDVTLSARGGDTGTPGPKQQKVEVTIYTLRNGVVRVEDTENSLYAAIDLVCDKVERKMVKVKELAIQKGKWPGKAGAGHRPDDLEEEEFQEYIKDVRLETQAFDAEQDLSAKLTELNKHYPPTVMRQKTLLLDPMTVEEAIDALEAVGHAFYVFREMITDTVQVVYKRNSGGYGVLLPQNRD